MLLLNFSHPLTNEQYAQIVALTGASIEEVRTIRVQIYHEQKLEPQIASIVESVNLSPYEWQTRLLLINPPGYALAASALLAELHGRIGHFPSIVRMRPKQQPGPTTIYEIVELLNLQALRESARMRR